jgi:diacylglycerol kinase family enzyme
VGSVALPIRLEVPLPSLGIGTLSYVEAKLFRSWRVDVSYRIGGEMVEQSLEVSLIWVVNYPYISSDMRPVRNADPEDGLMDVLIVRAEARRISLLRLFLQLGSGQFTPTENVFIVRVPDISIRCASNIPIEFDGNPSGQIDFLHLSIDAKKFKVKMM